MASFKVIGTVERLDGAVAAPVAEAPEADPARAAAC
jgi:hypothetical protein